MPYRKKLNSLNHEVPLHDLGKDGLHGLFGEFIDSDGVEMAKESWGHWVSASTWGSHCTDKLYFNQLQH